ncbi:MAG: hypothetical protein OEZ58_12465 [Gammaproteobacteria bacterium]|nr:hypothetical protein [Gammaproteobacteria bacterium]
MTTFLHACSHSDRDSLVSHQYGTSEQPLYEKYKTSFPPNLLEMSDDDFVDMLTPHVVQSLDGVGLEFLATFDAVEPIIQALGTSYPAFNVEAFANEKVQNLVNPQTGTPDQVMTEQDIEDYVVAEIRNELKKIGAEKNYIVISELATPQVQMQIAASIAELQNAIIDTAAVSQSIYDDLENLFGSKLSAGEIYLLVNHPEHWLDTFNASNNAKSSTKSLFNTTADSTSANSFQHSAWNAYLAHFASSTLILPSSESRGLWWAEVFTNAHEQKGENWDSKAGQMDLHNNKVGRDVYAAYAHWSSNYIYIKTWLGTLKIWVGYTYKSPIVSIIANLHTKALEAIYVNTGLPEKWTGTRFTAEVEAETKSKLLFIAENGNEHCSSSNSSSNDGSSSNNCDLSSSGF